MQISGANLLLAGQQAASQKPAAGARGFAEALAKSAPARFEPEAFSASAAPETRAAALQPQSAATGAAQPLVPKGSQLDIRV